MCWKLFQNRPSSSARFPPLNFDVCHGSAVDAALVVAEILHLGCLRFQHHELAREGGCCVAQSDILSTS